MDIKELAAQEVERKPHLISELVTAMFKREFSFIILSGFYIGFPLGCIQAILIYSFPSEWLLILFGAMVGAGTNWIAIQILVKPADPVNVLGIKFQGILLKRQAHVAEAFADTFTVGFLDARQAFEDIWHGKNKDEVRHLVKRTMRNYMEESILTQGLDTAITGPYGFRPGRGCHDAVRGLLQHLYRKPVQTIIDVDLAKFFDTIDHELLLGMLREKINDPKLLRYVQRMFKSVVLAEGELTVGDEGVPQGSLCSPVLANIYAHHVIDIWLEEVVKSHCAREVAWFRYADDLVVCCEYERDALRVLKALGGRLARYKLALNEQKTRLVGFARPRNGGPSPDVFDFLGFTFYWGRSRKGAPTLKVKTSGKRMRSKLKAVNTWGRSIRCQFPLQHIWAIFCSKLRGHIQYYGVSFNFRAVQNFQMKARRILFKWLNRRSQRRSLNWEQYALFIKANPLPKVTICLRCSSSHHVVT